MSPVLFWMIYFILYGFLKKKKPKILQSRIALTLVSQCLFEGGTLDQTSSLADFAPNGKGKISIFKSHYFLYEGQAPALKKLHSIRFQDSK